MAFKGCGGGLNKCSCHVNECEMYMCDSCALHSHQNEDLTQTLYYRSNLSPTSVCLTRSQMIEEDCCPLYNGLEDPQNPAGCFPVTEGLGDLSS